MLDLFLSVKTFLFKVSPSVSHGLLRAKLVNRLKSSQSWEVYDAKLGRCTVQNSEEVRCESRRKCGVKVGGIMGQNPEGVRCESRRDYGAKSVPEK